MSIMNGKAELDRGGNSGGNNGNGRSNNNRNNNQRGNNNFGNRNDRSRNNSEDGRSFGGKGQDYRFMSSSYLNDEARAEIESQKDGEQAEVNKHDQRADEIYDFLKEFQDSLDDFRQCKEVMVDKFPDVVKYIRSYYSQKNGPTFVDALNKLVLCISTTNFANTLLNILEHGDWEDGTYEKCWRNIAFALSIALETAHKRMHGSVIAKYATTILPRMWKPEIQDIARNTGVTRDLVLDLIIAIPMIDAEWNSANIDAFYPRFLDKMLIHAEDNMDVLNWEVQGMLYKRFFGNGKDALRVIGKYLTSEPRDGLDSEVERAVYDEFVKMLYSKLDEYDIKDIAYVFRYVAKTRKETDNAKTIFNSKDATAWENVRKGLLQVMDQDKETMNYLA